MHYVAVRLKESLIPFLGTLIFTKLAFCGFLGICNMSSGGIIAPVSGAILLVIKTVNIVGSLNSLFGFHFCLNNDI